MSWDKIKLQISDEVKKCMEERHILEDDVKHVINHAETENDKLYQPEANRYLASLTIGSATFYVEYSLEQENYLIWSAYAHKSTILG